MEADVVVVGAGPAGAAVSILLAQQGYRVALLDRAAFPRDKACAEYLSPPCSALLDQLGVLDAVLAAGPQRLQGMRVTDYRGRSCVGQFVQEGQVLQGLALPRRTLDHLLVQRAHHVGVALHTGVWIRQPLVCGKRLYGVRGTREGRPLTAYAPLVIAADGLHSVIGRRLGLIRPVRWLRHIAMVTHYADVQDCRPYGELFLIPSGYIGLAPVTAHLTNVSLVLHAARLRKTKTPPDVLLAQAIAAHPELQQRFRTASRVKKVLTTGPMAQRTRRSPYDGLLVVGDAAGFFDPFTGQGIFLALHSAQLAATTASQALASGDYSARALQSYYRTHAHAFRDKYRLSMLIQLGLRLPWLANRVIARLGQRPRLADVIVGVTGDFIAPAEVLNWRFGWRVLR